MPQTLEHAGGRGELSAPPRGLPSPPRGQESARWGSRCAREMGLLHPQVPVRLRGWEPWQG